MARRRQGLAPGSSFFSWPSGISMPGTHWESSISRTVGRSPPRGNAKHAGVLYDTRVPACVRRSRRGGPSQACAYHPPKATRWKLDFPLIQPARRRTRSRTRMRRAVHRGLHRECTSRTRRKRFGRNVRMRGTELRAGRRGDRLRRKMFKSF